MRGYDLPRSTTQYRARAPVVHGPGSGEVPPISSRQDRSGISPRISFQITAESRYTPDPRTEPPFLRAFSTARLYAGQVADTVPDATLWSPEGSHRHSRRTRRISRHAPGTRHATASSVASFTRPTLLPVVRRPVETLLRIGADRVTRCRAAAVQRLREHGITSTSTAHDIAPAHAHRSVCEDVVRPARRAQHPLGGARRCRVWDPSPAGTTLHLVNNLLRRAAPRDAQPQFGVTAQAVRDGSWPLVSF